MEIVIVHIFQVWFFSMDPEHILFLLFGQVLLFGVGGSLVELFIIADNGTDNLGSIFGGLELIDLLRLQFLRILEGIYFFIIAIEHLL